MPRQKRSLSDTISHLFRRFFDLDDPASSTIWTTTNVMREGEEAGVVKPPTKNNLKCHISSTSTKATHSHACTCSNSHKLTKSAPTTYTGTTAVSGTISKANEVYIHRSPSRAGKEGEEKRGEVKVKSVETIPKPLGSNANGKSTSNGNQNSISDTSSNPKTTSRLQSSALSQGQGKTSGGGTNSLAVGGIGISASRGGSSSSAAAVLTAANTSFELTPLSGLIKQSYKDIGTLRALEAEKAKMARDGGEGWAGETVDFDGMEDHLRRFEEVYRQFLRYGGRHGDSQEEVHLVAILCKRSDVLSSSNPSNSNPSSSKRGTLGSDPKREKDCGF